MSTNNNMQNLFAKVDKLQKVVNRKSRTPTLGSPCDRCGKDAIVGAHGIRGTEVFTEYWCEKCWSKRCSQ